MSLNCVLKDVSYWIRKGTEMDDNLMEASNENPDGSLSQGRSTSFYRTRRTLRGRIVGGEISSIRSYPWQVSLHVGFAHECGGSVLTNSWK